MKIRFLDLWNNAPIDYPRYFGILPYIMWVEQSQFDDFNSRIKFLYVGFFNFAIVFEFKNK